LIVLAQMAANGLRDEDQLDGASNYVIWKGRMSSLLDEHFLKVYVDSVVVEPANLDPLKTYQGERAKAKQKILDGVKDHVVCHISSKGTFHIISGIFRVVEDVLGAEDEIHIDA